MKLLEDKLVEKENLIKEVKTEVIVKEQTIRDLKNLLEKKS